MAGDVGEVALTLLNPLPTELKVPNLSLLHEGLDFEAYPSSLSLAPQSAPYNVGLHGAASQPGTLKLLGYSHNVLGLESQPIFINHHLFSGLQSECLLSNLAAATRDVVTVTVIPALPQV